ncbi:MAG: hypothetical protein ACYTFE_07060, partial [Planctomycetota bacterium]
TKLTGIESATKTYTGDIYCDSGDYATGGSASLNCTYEEQHDWPIDPTGLRYTPTGWHGIAKAKEEGDCTFWLWVTCADITP